MSKLKNEITKEKLKDLYIKKNLPYREIAKILNVSEGLISGRLRAYGINKNKIDMDYGRNLSCCKCGHVWISRLNKPKVCPKCTSVSWDIPSHQLSFDILKKKPVQLSFPVRKKTKSKAGYIYIRLRVLSLEDREKYAEMFLSGCCLEHRFIYSKHIGRLLLPNETIHHIDGNKSNNDINNLELVDSKLHGAKTTDLILEIKRLQKQLAQK